LRQDSSLGPLGAAALEAQVPAGRADGPGRETHRGRTLCPAPGAAHQDTANRANRSSQGAHGPKGLVPLVLGEQALSALLRRRRTQPTVIEHIIGRSSLADLAAAVLRLLREPDRRIVVRVVGFDYFDQNDLAAIADLSTWSPRVDVEGLDSFADLLLPQQVVDVRSAAERAVTHLSNVTVITAIVDRSPLDDREFEKALSLAVAGGRDIVTVDLRHLEQLSPAQLLAIAESSADVQRQQRTLILVNTTGVVAEQLRRGGQSAVLRMTVDDLS
jgi:anti-anti-sigma regulatory factor